MIYNSVGGGTGSGLGSLLLERLSVDYGKKTKMGVVVYPSSQLSYSSVEPYNTVLATHCLLEHQDVSAVYDNEALIDICEKKLELNNPNHNSLNRVITQTVCNATASIRFDGSLNTTLEEFQTNLVPYPRLHFLLASYSPFIPATKITPQIFSGAELTAAAFEPENHMVKCNSKYGKYIAVTMMYRGDFVPKDICCAIASVKTKRAIKFVDWCPTGFKVGINYESVPTVAGDCLAKTSKAVLCLSNTSSLREIFVRFNKKFDNMFTKRAFVHWYVGEGMEEGEISEARENSAALVADYEEIEEEIPEEGEGEQIQRN